MSYPSSSKREDVERNTELLGISTWHVLFGPRSEVKHDPADATGTIPPRLHISRIFSVPLAILDTNRR